MRKHTRTFASLITAGALLAVPASGLAAKPDDAGKPKAKNHSEQRCAAPARNVGFSVVGTFVSATADDPATPASEATITMTVSAANSHARKSGDIADQNATKKGVQVKGATFTIPAGDAFIVKLNGYEGTDTPSPGDRVKVNGKISMTKRQCAPAGTSTADRYGAIDVRKVTISDRDADA